MDLETAGNFTVNFTRGNWFKVNLDPEVEYSSNPVWTAAMINGVCNPNIAIGWQTTSETGAAGIADYFNDEIITKNNGVIRLPIITELSNGQTSVEMLGFVEAQFMGCLNADKNYIKCPKVNSVMMNVDIINIDYNSEMDSVKSLIFKDRQLMK